MNASPMAKNRVFNEESSYTSRKESSPPFLQLGQKSCIPLLGNERMQVRVDQI